MKDAPDIVKSILSVHGIADCHVIGVSMGSLVAQAFADRYPNLTRTVTVVGGYSIHRPTDKINKAQRKEMFRWLLYILFSMKKFRSYLISVSCYTPQGRKLFERGAVRFGRKSFSAMSGMNRLFHRNDGVVPYPLFIIVGEHDLPLAHEAAQEWHAAEPNSDYAVVPHAGHCANADRPEVFNEWVLGFIRDGASGSPDASFRLPL